MHISPERNPSKTSCFRSSDQNASVARIRSTATVLISTNSEVADISSRGFATKKTDNLPTREAAGCLCVKIRIMTWQKSGSLPLFFLEQNIGWYKALPVSDLKVWQLSTRLFESPSGSRKHIVVKTKKNVQSTKTISFCFLKKSFITIFWVPNTVGMMSFIISFTILPQSAERSGCWVVILLKDRRSSTFSLLN